MLSTTMAREETTPVVPLQHKTLRALQATQPSTNGGGSTTAGASSVSSASSEEDGLVVRSVVFGDTEITPEYRGLYREELLGRLEAGEVARLLVCDRCCKYTVAESDYVLHWGRCKFSVADISRLMYRKDELRIYEVDGARHTLFAQNLSNFAKLFIDTKSVCYDVHTFIYYILAEVPKGEKDADAKMIGFYSKEKLSWDSNNLACIVVFPPWQRRGYGQLLVAVSYELGRKENRIGGPERPLSEQGRQSYMIFWSRTIARYLLARPSNRQVTMEEISVALCMRPDDIVTTLNYMNVAGPVRPDKRVTIRKQAVRDWIQANGGDVDSPIDLDGLIAYDDDEDNEEGDEEEESEVDSGDQEEEDEENDDEGNEENDTRMSTEEDEEEPTERMDEDEDVT